MASTNPFNFSEWLRHETSTTGGFGTGDDVELGRSNTPDLREGTHVQGVTPNNAAFAGIYKGEYEFPNEPGIGVYGKGLNNRGIGVAGTCDHHGVGVYGMALDEGAGVVGRSMSGEQGETVPPVILVGRSAGVVGQSKKGVGVFGHGGPFIPLGSMDTTPPPDPDPGVRGGIFSAGWRTVQNLSHTRDPQVVSLSSRPQIQLLPSNNPVLPAQAQLGDIYFVIVEHERYGSIGQLWICTRIQGTTPFWQPVTLGIGQDGGSQVPP